MYRLIIKARSKMLVYLTHHIALPVLKLLRKPQQFPYSITELQLFPSGTLGKDLTEMLQYKALMLLPYYAKHDIKHLLLQYDTTDEGEVCLQCFMLGNRHLSFPVIATVLFGFATMPEHWGKFRKAWQRGHQCKPIEDWPWFALLHLPTQVLIQKINHEKD